MRKPITAEAGRSIKVLLGAWQHAGDRALTAAPQARAASLGWAGFQGWLLFLGIALPAVSWVWLLNGFPLVFPDTSSYLLSGLRLWAPWDRPIWYGLLLRLLRPIGLGGVALLQVAMALVAVRLAFGYLDRARPWATTALAVLLAGFTGLSWFGPFLIPDIFLPVIVLALYGIVFSGERARRWSVAGLLAVLLVGLLVHTSHILIVAVLLLAGLILWGLAAVWPWAATVVPRLPLARLLAIAGVIAVATLASAAVNRHAYGRWTLSPGGHAFLIDRFMADGTLKRVLDRHCAGHEDAFVDCGVRNELPSKPDWYLWNGSSPFRFEWQPAPDRLHVEMDGTRVAAELSRVEDERLISLSLREDPLAHVAAALKAAAEQLIMVRTGNELLVKKPWLEVEKAIDAYEPSALPRYRASLQARMRLPIDVSNRLNALF